MVFQKVKFVDDVLFYKVEEPNGFQAKHCPFNNSYSHGYNNAYNCGKWCPLFRIKHDPAPQFDRSNRTHKVHLCHGYSFGVELID